MTGFGRAEGSLAGGKVSVEIRSLNHRYLESSIRLPQRFSHLEGEVTKCIGIQLMRGKVEVSVRESGRDPVQAAWNGELAKSYIQLLKREAKRLRLKDDLALSALLHLPNLFENPKSKVATGPEWNGLKKIIQQAIVRCVAMRKREGQALKNDIEKRLKKIAGFVDLIDRHRDEFVQVQKDRLRKKAEAMAESIPLDAQRLEDQTVAAAERGDIAEELARARSHLTQMRQLLGASGAVGRRLDFLIQELQREINTIGSKGQSVSISRTVVDFKSELEKIREQIQNIE